MTELYSRRHVLPLLLLFPTALAAACSGNIQPPKTPSKIPVIPTVKPKDTPTPIVEREIEEEHLTLILNALRESGYPLFKSCADQIDFLHKSSINPEEFPKWVHEDSTPLKITTDESRESTATFQIQYKKLPEDGFLVTWQNGISIQHPGLEYFTFNNIKLGISSNVKAEGYIAEGMYLVKEYLTLMLSLQVAQKFYDVMNPSKIKFTDLNNKPITDKAKQIMAGVSVFLNQMGNQSTTVWEIVDGLPIYLVAGGIDTLLQRNKIGFQTNALSPFYDAYLFMTQNDNLLKTVNSFTEGWLQSGRFLPPPNGIGNAAFTDPLYQSVRDLQSLIKSKK